MHKALAPYKTWELWDICTDWLYLYSIILIVTSLTGSLLPITQQGATDWRLGPQTAATVELLYCSSALWRTILWIAVNVLQSSFTFYDLHYTTRQPHLYFFPLTVTQCTHHPYAYSSAPQSEIVWRRDNRNITMGNRKTIEISLWGTERFTWIISTGAKTHRPRTKIRVWKYNI